MKNLFKAAALGLALTAGLSSCESKKTETTVETPATGMETTTTTTTDTTMAPAAEGAMAPAAEGAMAPAAEGAMAPAATTTTTVTEEKK